VKHPFSVRIASVVFAFLAAFAYSEPLSGADISIRFFNRTVYYPGNSPSEPVMVQVTVTNDTPDTVRFKVADDHFFTLDFTAVNTRNLGLEHTDTWIRKRSTNQKIFFREISVEPGESYSFTENIKDYLKINEPGMYILDCAFYPELKQLSGDGESVKRSNRLTLEVKPSPLAASVSVMPVSPVSAEVLQSQPIPPDQVVTYIITARQKSHWEQFFLYFDLEKMIARDPSRGRRFSAESETGRVTMIENYKSELRQEKADKDISTIPTDFRIDRTSYTDTEGTVIVTEWFEYRTFREIKRYTYYLESKNGIWYIYDYTVDNIGTE
jgi:hypothetical protein